jgi:hypothetical protein
MHEKGTERIAKRCAAAALRIFSIEYYQTDQTACKDKKHLEPRFSFAPEKYRKAGEMGVDCSYSNYSA